MTSDKLSGSRQVYFPLSSNASSLVAGAGVGQVRRRLKTSSLLYDKVLIEAGQLLIQAGPNASSVFRTSGPDSPAGDGSQWQSTAARGQTQGARFSMSIAPETTPGVASDGPFREVVNSESTIAWRPTFHPFLRELLSTANWISFGNPGKVPTEIERVSATWKQRDEGSASLEKLLPIRFVRNQVISNLADDLAVGLAGQWDVSADVLHSQVFQARFADTTMFAPMGFALPILVPDAHAMGWDSIGSIRRMKAIEQLRAVLREIELEALATATSGGDVERAVHRIYEKRITPAHSSIESALPQSGIALGEVMIGITAGYATIGLGMWGGLVGAAPGATLAGLGVARRVRAGNKRRWIGVMQSIQSAVN